MYVWICVSLVPEELSRFYSNSVWCPVNKNVIIPKIGIFQADPKTVTIFSKMALTILIKI
jgi:hypothetical protein